MTYVNWPSGEPSSQTSAEDCDRICDRGVWNDVDCNLISNIICEKDLKIFKASNKKGMIWFQLLHVFFKSHIAITLVYIIDVIHIFIFPKMFSYINL